VADVNLPNNAPVRRNVGGMIIASRNLADVTTAGGESVAICELPVGAVVVTVGAHLSIIMALTDIGIEGPDIVDDPDFFAVNSNHGADDALRANLNMGYEAETEGEVVTFTPANAITAVSTGRAWVSYSLNADVV